MRFTTAAAAVSLALGAVPATAQVFVTSIIATNPDPNGKLPGGNLVADPNYPNWTNGYPQSVLVVGQSYEYCVSVASGRANGSASVAYAIVRGKTVIQQDTFIEPSQFPVGKGGVWYWCAGYHELPDSPGKATLEATVVYTPNGETTSQKSEISVPVLLQKAPD